MNLAETRSLGAPDDVLSQIAWTLVTTRSTTLPKRLVAPGPSDEQLARLFEMAAAAPDHGQLVPWRFVLVPRQERHRLADVFARALLDRDSGASPDQIEAAREKAHRAPLLAIAVARLGPDPSGVPALERMVSLGAAVQNLLLGAHAMGFGAGLTSGKAMASGRMVDLLGLGPGEVAVCCINLGTVSQAKARTRSRPAPADFVTTLGPLN
jgi:nitroreductase